MEQIPKAIVMFKRLSFITFLTVLKNRVFLSALLIIDVRRHKMRKLVGKSEKLIQEVL